MSTLPYVERAIKLGKLLVKKNAAYGDSFEKSGQIMAILYPNGIAPDQMVDALCVVRIIDKCFRIATNKDAFGESPYQDIAGYGILGSFNHEKHDATIDETASGQGLSREAG